MLTKYIIYLLFSACNAVPPPGGPQDGLPGWPHYLPPGGPQDGLSGWYQLHQPGGPQWPPGATPDDYCFSANNEHCHFTNNQHDLSDDDLALNMDYENVLNGMTVAENRPLKVIEIFDGKKMKLLFKSGLELNPGPATSEIKEARSAFGLPSSSKSSIQQVSEAVALMASRQLHRLRSCIRHALALLNDLPISFFGKNFEDCLFREILTSSSFSEESETLTLSVSGFDPKVHKVFLQAFESKFNVETTENGAHSFNMNIEVLTNPYNSSLKIPGFNAIIKCGFSDLIELQLVGHTGILVPACFLKEIVYSFIKDLRSMNYKLADIYQNKSSGSSSSSSEDLPEPELSKMVASSTPRKSTPKETFNDCIFSPIKSNNVSEESSRRKVTSRPKNDQQSKEMTEEEKDNLTIQCPECGLHQLSRNILQLVGNPSDFKSAYTCKFECFSFKDSLETFVDAFFDELIANSRIGKRNIKKFKANMDRLYKDILDKITNGRARLYFKILGRVDGLEIGMQDKVMTILNTIASMTIEMGGLEFKEELMVNKDGRKTLIRYITSTGNFFGLQSVVESLLLFFSVGIDITKLLPSPLHCIIDSFRSAESFGQGAILYHQFVSDTARNVVINVLMERNIEILKLKEETFLNRIIPAGRDLFLYYNKLQQSLNHFVVFSDECVYFEKLDLNSLIYDEKTGQISNKQWIFKLQEGCIPSKSLHQLFTNIHSVDTEICFKKQGNYDQDLSTDDCMEDHVEPKEHVEDFNEEGINVESTTIHVERGGTDDDQDSVITMKDDSIDDDDCPSGTDDSGSETCYEQTVIETGFVVGKECIKEYWNPSEHGQNRKFVTHAVGVDWPLLYGSPCAILITYNHVKSANSRKTHSNFAKLRGSCKICKSSHIYDIEDSPFKETFRQDGSIRYEASKDMVVNVTAKGKFKMKDLKPDITQPYHEKEMASGLCLKGEERRLIGMKASKEGASSTYREQMAYLQKDQILLGNRTSVREGFNKKNIKSYGIFHNGSDNPPPPPPT